MVHILHQDDWLIAIHKPPGILVHRSREAPDRDVLVRRVRDAIGQRVFPVHRLDRGTSGVILFGLSSAAAGGIQKAMQASQVRKDYLVLVRNSTEDAFESRVPMKKKTTGKMQEAHTEFLKLGEFSRSSLLRARLHTGRRHQIRRHLNYMAHQVIGDRKYGKNRINDFFRGHLRPGAHVPARLGDRAPPPGQR